MLPHVVPTHFKAKYKADDTLVLGFAPYTLEKGVCYKLGFAKPEYSMFGSEVSMYNMLIPELAGSLDLKVCTSGCECDVLGTLKCEEREG